MRTKSKALSTVLGLLALVSICIVALPSFAAYHDTWPVLGKVQHLNDDNELYWSSSTDFDSDASCEGVQRDCFHLHGLTWDYVFEIQIRVDHSQWATMYDEKCYYYDWDSAYNWVLAESDCIHWDPTGYHYTWWWEEADIDSWNYDTDNLTWYMAYAYKHTSADAWYYTWTKLVQ
jgi:hypothetical protein